MKNLYFILFILPIIGLNTIAEKKKNKKIMILATILLSLIVGLRGINVGIDTRDYYYAIINNFPRKWQFEELGFRFISTILMNIFNNPTIVVFIYALLTDMLIMLRFWDFREKCNFATMSSLYILIFMFSTMNIMRQFLAIAIVFYFTRYLEKKKYIIYIIAVIIASTIHKTALLAILVFIVYFWNDLSKNKKILATIPMILISTTVFYYIIKYENDHITNYISTEKMVDNINITFSYRFLIFVFSYLLEKYKIKIVLSRFQKYNKIQIKETNLKFFKIVSLTYLFGLCFVSLGMFYEFVGRIGFYCLIFEPVYWGYISNNGCNKLLNIMLITIYGVYVFMMEIFLNGSGVFPYYWNI